VTQRLGMDLSDPDTRDGVTARLAERYAGRPVLMGPGVLAGYTSQVEWFRELGCPVLVVATAIGAAPIPQPDDCQVVEIVPPPAATMTDEVRQLDRTARHLPPAAMAAIEAFDPARQGVWFASPFVTTDEPIDGRPVAFGRPASFLALEDKTLADAIWEAAGVASAAYRVVPNDEAALAAATAELAGPLGAVWSGDARDGVNGGGNYVRWILDDDDQQTAAGFFRPRCDRIRVMPFVDGVPCSIHGYVLPEGTAAFRPVEIVSLRDVARRQFVYGGLGTYWDPPVADREEMRAAACRVGDHLAAAHGYRGAFGIDGVLSAEGFLPTELNTRMSGGASLVCDVDRRFFTLLQAALVSGDDVGLTAADVESLVPVMDAERVGRVAAIGQGVYLGGAFTYPVSYEGGRMERSVAETGNTLSAADTPNGFFAKVDPCAALGPGQRMAEINLALVELLDRDHGAGFGALEAGADVRR
jgi:hypothetical protein